MKNRLISKAVTLLVFTLISSLTPTTKTYAQTAESTDNSEIAEEIYEQLVTNGQSKATFKGVKYDREDEGWEDYAFGILEELCEIDEETPYDATAILGRGTLSIKKSGSTYTVILYNAYDIDEADKVIDEIIETEIADKITEDTTDKEIMYIIADYLTSNYEYDYETAALDPSPKIERQTFVDAYYGNHKLICSGYSNIAYLIATKLGINCKIILTDKHQYMTAQVGDKGEYIAYDFTGGRYASIGIVKYIFGYNNLGNTGHNVLLEALFKKNTYTFTDFFEPYRQFWFYIKNGYSISLSDIKNLALSELTVVLLLMAVVFKIAYILYDEILYLLKKKLRKKNKRRKIA